MPNNIWSSPFWFGHSTEFWSSVSSKLLVVAVITGIFAAIASGLSSWIGGEVTSKVQEIAGSRLTNAELELKKAGEETAALVAKAEVARSQIAVANAEAAQARLETEHLRQQMAWRRISPQQHAIIVDALRGHKITVWTSWVGKDPEATVFRNDIDQTLKDAAVETKYFSGWEMAIGLKLTETPAGEDRDLLIAAFRKAGIEFIPVPRSRGGEELEIIVGTKPPPF